MALDPITATRNPTVHRRSSFEAFLFRHGGTHRDTQHPLLPLNPSKREIRLLHRCKGSTDHDYRLSVFPFDDAPPFFALSYVWGSSPDRNHVVVEGLSVPVTTNLAAALAQVWGVADCEYLWADALCINQSDTHEKNHQVPLMRHIYGRSSRVLMWLGDASADSDLAMEFLREWAGAIRGAVDELRRNDKAIYLDGDFTADNAWVHDPEERVKASAAAKSIFAQFPAPFATRAFDDKSWGAVDALFERSYWTRIWILQEVVLANVATVMCGAKTLDLDDLIAVLPMFTVMIYCALVVSPSDTERPLTLMHCEMVAFLMIHTMRSMIWKEKSHLLYLANHTMDYEATDARDRVFALLGLIPEGDTSIVPNYSLSVQQVFIDVVVDHLNRIGRYVPIAGIGQNAAARLPGLPSWVPDFTIESRLGTEASWQNRHGNTNVASRASGTRPVRFTVARMPPDGCLLRIRGFICDQVAALSDAYLDSRCYFCQLRTCLEEMASQTRREPSSLLATGVPWLYAIFRSLTIAAETYADPRAMGKLAVGFLLMLGMSMDTDDHAWRCTNDAGEAVEDRETIWARFRTLVGEVRTTHPHLQPPIAFLARYVERNGAGTEQTEESILAKFCGVVGVHLSASFLEVPCQDFGDAEYFALYKNLEAVLLRIDGASLVVTKSEQMGFAEPGLQVGDVVCIIFGCDVPIVARRVEQDRLLMIGQGRFHGMMYGELMDKLEEGAFEEQDLVFI
ncbi:heterokaryon incompatibility protein-domain-containing protein [Schizothecium vesticola]|uniref:Heterokaryon incompatibility protein-domain-containing protein n=1 Tax=Schizothecium vesticola TaxID=314040 RepID=A0AA40F406_9PEZI|nr:heterokaryon incompatibility protein-domain-containing protein [Schizothecium vesticola]